jgi:hypothetical protein
MGNFANWPRWIHACLAIVAVALGVAGLRTFPELQHIPRKSGTLRPVYSAKNETLFYRLS